MASRSPTLQGFELMLRQPSLGLAEIVWRWSFGFALTALALFGLHEYLATLNVTNGELFLLRTGHPALVSHAILRILQGSGSRAALALIVMAIGGGMLWVLAATVGRTITLRRILDCFHSPSSQNRLRLGSMAELHVLRLAVSFAAILAGLAALLIASRISTPRDPSPGS